SNLPGAAGTLTIGPGVRIHGQYGSIIGANANSSLMNQGTISADSADLFIPADSYTITLAMTGTATFTNTGTLSAQNGGVLSILSNTGTATFINTGTLSAQTGGRLSVPVSLTLGVSSSLSESLTGAMEFKGNLLSAITNPAQFTPQGKVTLNGSGTV